MPQRIMIGISVVMVVYCVAVVGIAWSLIKESQAINQNMMALLATITDRLQPVAVENRDQEILKPLDVLKQVQRDQAIPVTEQTSQISFQLVQETNIGKPAIGFLGQLTKSGGKSDSFTLSAVVDKSGKLDFGKLPCGRYSLQLHSQWNEYATMSKFTTIPGHSYSQTIVCPTAAPKRVPVQFQVNWSDKLKSEDWVLLCDFRSPESSGGAHLLTRRIGHVRWTSNGQFFTGEDQPLVYLIDKENQVSICPLDQQGEYKDLDQNTLVEKQSINIIEGENYTLAIIYLIQKHDLKKLSSLNLPRSWDVLVNKSVRTISFDPNTRIGSIFGASADGVILEEETYIPFTSILAPFKKIDFTSVIDDSILNRSTLHTKTIDGILLTEVWTYTALKDQPNVWEIKFPSITLVEPDSSNSAL